jgi:hypothetical protein
MWWMPHDFTSGSRWRGEFLGICYVLGVDCWCRTLSSKASGNAMSSRTQPSRLDIPVKGVVNGETCVIVSRNRRSNRPSGCLRHPREDLCLSVSMSHDTAIRAIGRPCSVRLNLLICSLARPFLAFVAVRKGAALRLFRHRFCFCPHHVIFTTHARLL